MNDTGFAGRILVQNGADFPNQAIHELLPFGSSGLAHCRRDLVDPRECEFRFGKFPAHILKALICVYQPMDRQIQITGIDAPPPRPLFVYRPVRRPSSWRNSYPETTVAYRMEAASACKLRGQQGNFLPHSERGGHHNPIERLNGEIKWRTEVVGIFRNDDAIVRFVGALLLEQNDEWAGQRARYMTLKTISQMSDAPLLPAVAR